MPDETTRFHTAGPSWSDRASLGGVRAVLSPDGSDRRNNFLHGIHSYGANCALQHMTPNGHVVDFGCGTGRFTRFFALRGQHVLATEISAEMIYQAQKESVLANCEFKVTDGILIPVPDASIDCIWCCAVLRYSLFVSDPAYADISREMFRVLRPGGYVINLEMYVDQAPDVFTEDFETAGFTTRRVSVLQRYGGRPERWLNHRLFPEGWVFNAAGLVALLRSHFDSPRRSVPGLRDYLFYWQKPDR